LITLSRPDRSLMIWTFAFGKVVFIREVIGFDCEGSISKKVHKVLKVCKVKSILICFRSFAYRAKPCLFATRARRGSCWIVGEDLNCFGVRYGKFAVIIKL